MIGVESEFEELLSVVVDDVVCGMVRFNGGPQEARQSVFVAKSPFVPEASVESSVLQKLLEIL
jgi:hypothetical protein